MTHSYTRRKKDFRTYGDKKPNTYRSMRPRQRKKPITQFDPTMFMRRVEEQIPAEAYIPKHTFATFSIDRRLKNNIEKKGYVSPTPIQDQAVPYILEGRDIIGTANTGTGKTAAFLIPLIDKVLKNPDTRVLIITPTRELAVQIQDELVSFTLKTNIRSALCIGGRNILFQLRALKQKPSFVIGTPKRLMDLERNGHISFSSCSTVVLDEVDRMLDMGFIGDMRSIIGALPKKRHSLFFSATLSDEVQKIAHNFLYNPVSVSVKTRQSAENVNQEVIPVSSENKIDVVHDLLIKPEYTKVLVFLRTKHGVDKLAKALSQRGFSISLIHGGRTQAHRCRALSLFKAGKVKVLLATDVVSRGIDINDVSHVINFDLPQTYEDYIHRIGRTGRADKVGQAITFVPNELL